MRAFAQGQLEPMRASGYFFENTRPSSGAGLSGGRRIPFAVRRGASSPRGARGSRSWRSRSVNLLSCYGVRSVCPDRRANHRKWLCNTSRRTPREFGRPLYPIRIVRHPCRVHGAGILCKSEEKSMDYDLLMMRYIKCHDLAADRDTLDSQDVSHVSPWCER